MTHTFKNNTKRSIIFCSVFTYGIFMACNSPAKKVENAQENLKEAKTELKQSKIDSIADYEIFKAESELRIQNNEKIIAAYKERMRTDKKAIKANDQKMIDELEERNINMRRKVETFKNEGKDNWQDFKVEFNHDMDELGTALKNLTVKNTN